MFMLAMHIGNSIGPVVLGGVADWLDLEFTFYGAAISMAIGVWLFAWLIRDPSGKPEPIAD